MLGARGVGRGEIYCVVRLMLLKSREMGAYSLASFAVLAFLCSIPRAHSEEKCLDGKYHKESPSPDIGADYKTCEPWQNKSCCTADFTAKLVANQTQTLYNHSWHRCGQLSKKCENFWIKQECFYQCSPYLYKWTNPEEKGSIHGVPVCASQCDAWFDACKDDKICVEDVLGGYNFTVHGENICPAPKNCTTYKLRYKNGQGLCNKMWGTSYVYTEDGDSCMKMWFNGSNPNGNVAKPVVTTAKPTEVGSTAATLASSAFSVMVGLAVLMQVKLHMV